MSVHGAEVGDIYVDANGRLWRVVGTCNQPTVEVQAIEPTVPGPNSHWGGINGLIWNGYKRIFRPGEGQ